MSTELSQHNNIFGYAFAGALLFTTAVVYMIAYSSNIITMELSYTLVAIGLGIASVSLLYHAIRKDRNRLRQV